jgi:hypothetical protein
MISSMVAPSLQRVLDVAARIIEVLNVKGNAGLIQYAVRQNLITA